MTRQTVGNEERDGDLTVAGDLSVSGSVANPTFTGVAQFPDGSASAPSITNTGDTNTGIAFPAADTVAVTTGGTERLRVDSSGLVGIGTDAPATTLHVAKSSQATLRVESETTTQTDLRIAVDSSSGPQILISKSRGSIASPASVQDGDILGTLQWRGYNGTLGGYSNAAYLRVEVDGTPESSGDSTDMPGRMAFYTTADGAGSPSERMRIDSNGLITGTGTSLGAWTAYTPTLAGAGWAIGDGTIGGWYNQIGKMVFFRAYVVFGSTSTYGNANPSLSLPVTSRTFNTDYARYFPMSATAVDSSLATSYMLGANSGSNTAIQMRALTTSSAYTTLNSTTPFTWASSDSLIVAGAYEAA